MGVGMLYNFSIANLTSSFSKVSELRCLANLAENSAIFLTKSSANKARVFSTWLSSTSLLEILAVKPLMSMGARS